MATMMSGQMTKLFSAFVLVLIGTALAPEIFSNISGMDNTSTPAWLITTLTAVVGAGILFLIWRAVE